MTKKVTDYSCVIRLPADLANALRDRAELEDRPIARIIRQAIREYIEAKSEGGT